MARTKLRPHAEATHEGDGKWHTYFIDLDPVTGWRIFAGLVFVTAVAAWAYIDRYVQLVGDRRGGESS